MQKKQISKQKYKNILIEYLLNKEYIGKKDEK
jgi:hypothetical protein